MSEIRTRLRNGKPARRVPVVRSLVQFWSLTSEEYYRINGTLTASMIEDLLDLRQHVTDVKDCEAHAAEARASYPNEGFLSDAIHALDKLAKSLKGENKQIAVEISDKLSKLEQECYRDAEYGREELRQAIKLMKALPD